MTPTRRAAPARFGSDASGSVYVEFLIIVLPLLVFILALVQTAFMYVGSLAVRRAANTAARAAVVILDDDPDYYNGAPRNSVDGGSSRLLDPVNGFVIGLGGGVAPPVGLADSARLQDIRAAASIPLLAVSPKLGELIDHDSVYEAIGGKSDEGRLAGAAMYNRGAMAVTFPTSPGASSYRTRFDRDDDVTVRVTYMFHCGVPLVRYIMCESIPSIKGGFSADGIRELIKTSSDPGYRPSEVANAAYKLRVRTERIARWRGGELDQAEAPWLIDLAAPSGARFFVMTEEATLPNQGADYDYGGSSWP